MHHSIKAILFDLDGVLVHSPLDLASIKRELFGDSEVFILEGLLELPDSERHKKERVLLQRELEAAHESVLAPGVVELFEWMESHGLSRGVITRNASEVVELIARKHNVDFGVIVARENAPPKPDPACVQAACRQLGIFPGEAVMVGDFRFDIDAGRNAGCRTVFLETEKFSHLKCGEEARIKSLPELIPLVEKWCAGDFMSVAGERS